MLRWFHQFGSPKFFYRFSSALLPWLAVACGLAFAWGLYQGLWLAPKDYQQGDSVRIMYVHVPAAWMSLLVYVVMALSGALGFIWRIKLAEIISLSSAPIGAAFTFMALATGALWGKPTWGTYWQWDARMTSELLLLFLYCGVMALYAAIDDKRLAARAAAILAIVGVVNLPIIHYSVVWWNSLHQGSIFQQISKPSVHPSMLWPLLIMLLAYKLLFVICLLQRTRNELLRREANTQWVQELLAR